MSASRQAARECSAWPKDALRITFGVIWAIDLTSAMIPEPDPAKKQETQ